MNYYEELGLTPHSSADQIKEAYRALMRLLHPDHHSEPLLQQVAEQQVKKLNAVYAVLADPERRRRYDQSLLEETERATPIIIHAPAPERRRAYVNRNSIAWVVAVSVFAILLIWMASRPTPVAPAYTQDSGATPVESQPAIASPAPAPVAPSPAPTPAPAAADPAIPPPALVAELARNKAEMDGLRVLLSQTTKERDNFKQELISFQEAAAKSAKERALEKAALEKITLEKAALQRAVDERAAKEKLNRQLARAQDQRPPEQKPQEKTVSAKLSPEPVRQAKIPAAAPVLMAKTEPPPPPPELAPVLHNALAGAWVYRKPAAPPKNKDLYPPEFIETVITEDNGQLRGTYHARYQVPNRPVSPEVAFQFNGRMFGDSGSLPWSGTGGSKGEVTLTLTADHSLRVDWVASQLGSLGFYKGTAVLVKKSD